jgi:hypothetical protein
MAQFKEVFSTTAKVVLALFIIAAVLVIVGSIPVGGPDTKCERPACREAHEEVERILDRQQAEYEAKMLEIKTKIAYAHSDADGDLYVRCTTGDPPRQPANQRRCQALIHRIDDEIEANRAASAKARAKW